MLARKLGAEVLGTFLLTFMVRLSLSVTLIWTPVIAGLTLGLGVYMLGSVSGAHFNPAVTIGLATIRKISPKDAALYVIAQLLGGYLAMLVVFYVFGIFLTPGLPVVDSMQVAVAEAFGAAILVLGVSSVVHGKAPHDASGLTIGTALTLGAVAASSLSNGIVNPAVALGLGSFSVAYVLGPIVGGIVAAWLYKTIIAAK